MRYELNVLLFISFKFHILTHIDKVKAVTTEYYSPQPHKRTVSSSHFTLFHIFTYCSFRSLLILSYNFHLRWPGYLSRRSDSLRPGRSWDQILVETRFSAPVQTGPGVYPASYTMGTGSFTGVNRPGRGVDHPTPSSAEVKERVELYFYSPSRPSWPILGWNLSPSNISSNFSFRHLLYKIL